MKIEQRINQIKLKCQEIASFPNRYELTEPFYWPLLELMDIDDEDFVLKLYSEADVNCLSVLCDTYVISSMVEVLQSDKLVSFIKELQTKHMDLIDDVLILDLESTLFINFEEPPDKNKADNFLLLYRKMKKLVTSFSKNQEGSVVLENVDKLIDFIMLNNNEYFSYVNVYWLKSYIENIIHLIRDKEKIREKKIILSKVFSRLRFDI